jgi:hypothetical protein
MFEGYRGTSMNVSGNKCFQLLELSMQLIEKQELILEKKDTFSLIDLTGNK